MAFTTIEISIEINRFSFVVILTNLARLSASSSSSFSSVSCGVMANVGGVIGAPRVILPLDDC